VSVSRARVPSEALSEHAHDLVGDALHPAIAADVVTERLREHLQEDRAQAKRQLGTGRAHDLDFPIR